MFSFCRVPSQFKVSYIFDFGVSGQKFNFFGFGDKELFEFRFLGLRNFIWGGKFHFGFERFQILKPK